MSFHRSRTFPELPQPVLTHKGKSRSAYHLFDGQKSPKSQWKAFGFKCSVFVQGALYGCISVLILGMLLLNLVRTPRVGDEQAAGLPGDLVYDISHTMQSYRVRTSRLREFETAGIAGGGLRRERLSDKNGPRILPGHSESLQSSNDRYIPFAESNLFTEVEMALQYPYDKALPLYKANSLTRAIQHTIDQQEKALLNHKSRVVPEKNCPIGEVKVFIGIASRSSVKSREKRDAIRKSWLADIHEQYPEVRAMFLVSQPKIDGDEAEFHSIAEDLAEEYSIYGDIAIIPGPEEYRSLPTKTFSMLRFGLSSECKYTHIVKTDDDVYLRVSKLLDIIYHGTYHATMKIRATTKADEKGVHRGIYSSSKTPWKTKLYVGKIDRNVTNTFPGFEPVRDPRNKWYLSSSEFPDSISPKGIRWISGWGYLMSRDVAQKVWDSASNIASKSPDKRPSWWGLLPWEDVVVASLLQDYVPIYHHEGFKAAWDPCDKKTVLKHLDNQAPRLTAGLEKQDKNGLWDAKEVTCSMGDYEAGDYEAWRLWRNSLPDVRITGRM
eukprot:jgi/Picsp_1/2403/NSC_05864-R1_udp-gal:beta c beta - polypeptide 4